jgi:hypothetical protein
MKKFRKYFFDAVVIIVAAALTAAIMHRCDRKPTKVIKVERDTIVQYDTVPHWYPKPVEVTKTKTEYRWLTRVQPVGKTDTLTLHDSVLVEVPIESRHYHGEEYDAYISGYLTSLDSIFIRQKTEYITERITQMKPPNRWELDLVGGVDYNINNKVWLPYAGGELTLNRHKRLQLGIEGGVQWRDNTIDPYAGVKARYRLF